VAGVVCLALAHLLELTLITPIAGNAANPIFAADTVERFRAEYLLLREVAHQFQIHAQCILSVI
jgi:hypothetical protein